jgi:hypothetical protein
MAFLSLPIPRKASRRFSEPRGEFGIEPAINQSKGNDISSTANTVAHLVCVMPESDPSSSRKERQMMFRFGVMGALALLPAVA